MNVTTERKYIVRVEIEKLFGQYSYDLAPKADPGSLSQLFLLYGENGTGKTTILLLVNHLLSRELGSGHRTYLARTQFSRVAVHLNDHTVISAVRPEPANGNFTMTVDKNGELNSFSFEVNKRGVIGKEVSQSELFNRFHAELPDLRITFLGDDRKVTAEGSRVRRYALPHNSGQFVAVAAPSGPENNPSALEPSLDGLHGWATRRALEGSKIGQRDTDTVYVDLLKRLSHADEHQEPLAALIERLAAQQERSLLFSRFGLTSEIDAGPIIATIANSHQSRQQVLAQVVKPYLDANEARLDALDKLQKTLATFVDELNGKFFKRKQVGFDLAQGVTIESGGETLEPEVMSSGEKQLLVLFCNVAQASDRESIFIIDEPELSLNVDWQRYLISALQKLGSGCVQFVLATHSLELLARHRNNLSELSESEVTSPLRKPAHEEGKEE